MCLCVSKVKKEIILRGPSSFEFRVLSCPTTQNSKLPRFSIGKCINLLLKLGLMA